jgi:hypothetical protein
MPGGNIQTDMLSGIEEESDIYEGFAPHVDCANIPLSNESSPGEFFSINYTHVIYVCMRALKHVRH